MRPPASLGALRHVTSFGGLTLLSRGTGVVRDIAIATAFGAGPASDAFVLAFRIPNALRRLFADGALSAAFVPAVVRQEREDHRGLPGFIARLAGTLSVVVATVCALGMLLAGPLAWLFAPGAAAHPGQLALVALLLRILFPYLLCVSLAALAGAVLVSHGRFARWALAPAALNLAMAAGAAWLAPRLAVPITALAWAVLLGGVAQVCWLWRGVARLGLLRWPRWGGRDPRVRGVARAMGPIVFGASVAQLNLLFASAAASLLAVGSQTWLFQADRFLELPLALFGASMGIVLLPTLTRECAQATGRAARTLAWALHWLALASLPAALALVTLAEPLMLTFFQYGRYSTEDARMAACALAAMSLGLPALAALKVMLPACHARGDLVTPVRASCIALACNVAATGVLLAGGCLATAGEVGDAAWRALLARPGTHALLALGGAIANTCNALVLWRGLRRAGLVRLRPASWSRLWRIALASVLMAFVLGMLQARMDFDAAGAGRRITLLSALVASGGASFATTWYLLGGRLPALSPAKG